VCVPTSQPRDFPVTCLSLVNLDCAPAF
jgi:hypothetical protein